MGYGSHVLLLKYGHFNFHQPPLLIIYQIDWVGFIYYKKKMFIPIDFQVDYIISAVYFTH